MWLSYHLMLETLNSWGFLIEKIILFELDLNKPSQMRVCYS